MPDLPTRVDLFNIGADEVLARSEARPPGQRITAEEIFTEGSDINIVAASASAMGEETIRQLALRLAALFLATAEEEDLDRLVADRFSPTIVRKTPAPATVPLTIDRSAGAFPAGTLPVGTQVRTALGTTFALQLAVSFALGEVGPKTVEAQALEAGTAGNVATGTITSFVQTPFDVNLRVTNDEPAAGGDDRETDASLRARAKDFFRTARRGTLAAIEFGALTVEGVRKATAIELTNDLGEPNGYVQLFVSDAQGQANSLLVTAVRSALLEYRAAGVVVDVISGEPVYVSIRYRLRFEAGIDSTEAFAAIQQGTLAAVNALRPRETLPVSLLFEIARSVPGVIVLEDAVQAPIGDLVPTGSQVIRTRLDLITAE